MIIFFFEHESQVRISESIYRLLGSEGSISVSHAVRTCFDPRLGQCYVLSSIGVHNSESFRMFTR